MSRIYRLLNGQKWPPALRDGAFILGDPAAGNQKHHAAYEVVVRTEQEAIELLRKGYSIRVETDSSPSLVRKNLFVDGLKIS